MQTRSGRPVVGMALYGDVTYDSRVRKEARTLAASGYDVSIFCLGGDDQSSDLPRNVNVIVNLPAEKAVLPAHLSKEGPNPFRAEGGGWLAARARRAAWVRAYISTLRAWGRQVAESSGPIDIWHLHDLTGLAAVAPHVDDGIPMVYDSHELYVDAGTAALLPKPARTLLRAYERHLVGRVSAVITVNEEIARVLQRRYRPRRVDIVRNCPDRWTPPDTRPTFIRDAAGIPGDAPVILYHGMLSAGRGIERLMEALLQPGLEDAHLVLLGMGEDHDRYLELAGESRWHRRVHLLDPVPPADLLPWVSSADVGAMPNPGATLNDKYSSPNKLFECLAAGIPVVASDVPTIRRIVAGDPSNPLGVVCDPSRIESIAAALRSILELDDPASEAIRARCLAAAWDRWNWEVESAGLTRLYGDLIR